MNLANGARPGLGTSLLLLGLVSSTTLMAQDAGTLIREQEAERNRAETPELRAPSTDALPPAEPVEESGDTVLVSELVITGEAELLPPAQRQALEASVIGQRLDINGLQAQADRVTAYLQQQGHLLASAILPPQDVTEGRVMLQIREGTLEGFNMDADAEVRTRSELLRGVMEQSLAASDSGRSVTRILEDALLRVNDLPGITARGALAPGSTPNTSRLSVQVEQAPMFSGGLYSNNHGVDSTGEAQMLGNLRLRDVSGYGDDTDLILSHAEGQDYLGINHGLPLGASRFTARAAYSQLDYEHREDPGKSLGLEGRAQRLTLGLDYALIRSRNLRLDLNADYLQQHLKDESTAGTLQDKRVDAWRLGFSGDYRDNLGRGGITQFTALLTAGELDLSRVPGALAADRAGLQTDGHFETLNLSLARYQFLPHENFTLYGRLQGQWASKNLDSSQKLSLGGPYGLRGWPVSEGQGDSGLMGTLELRYQVPGLSPANGSLQLTGFVDAGRIQRNEDSMGLPPANACACNSYSLKSAGLELNWQYRDLRLAATWARGLGDNPGRSATTGNNLDGDNAKQQFWLQASFSF